MHDDLARSLRAWRNRLDPGEAGLPANYHASSRKTIHHPLVGGITVDCDVLQVTGSDLRMVVWTAAPGTSDADALTLLGTIAAGAPAPSRG